MVAVTQMNEQSLKTAFREVFLIPGSFGNLQDN